MAKALAKEPALAPALPKIETPVKAMPPLPPWRQPPVPPMFQNVFAEHMANQLPGMLAQCTGIANATTGQSSEFGDLWKSWAKDAPCCC